MRIEFKKSFYHTLRYYDQKEQYKIIEVIELLVKFFEKSQIPHGLGLKLLKPKRRIWEARAGSNIRIIFRYEKNLLEFALVGNHDDIKRYIKRSFK